MSGWAWASLGTLAALIAYWTWRDRDDPDLPPRRRRPLGHRVKTRPWEEE